MSVLVRNNDMIKYKFTDEEGKELRLEFSMVEVECTVGGFSKQVNKALKTAGLGVIVDVQRELVF